MPEPIIRAVNGYGVGRDAAGKIVIWLRERDPVAVDADIAGWIARNILKELDAL